MPGQAIRTAAPAISGLWSLRRERPRFVGLALATLGVLLAYPFVDWYLRAAGVAVTFEFYDWGAITAGAARWYRGDPIYVRGEWGYHGSYLYPPVYLPVVAAFAEIQSIPGVAAVVPFADGPFEASAMVWGLATLGLLWAGLQLAVAAYGLDLGWLDRAVLLWALLGFQPLLYSLKMGQVAAFLGAMLCFALVGLERGARSGDGEERSGTDVTRRRAARLASGAFTTLGSLTKPFYATAGAHLLRDRRRFLGAVAAGLAMLGLSLGLFGVDAHRAYLDVLLWGKGWGTIPKPPWLWHAGYYEPLYVVASRWPSLSLVVRLVGLLAIVALSLAARNDRPGRRTFALGLAAIPFFAPQAYTFEYVALLPAVVVLLAVEFDRGPAGRPWLPVVAVLLLAVHAYGLKLVVHHLPASVPLYDPLVAATPVLQPGLWGNLALVGLAAYRVAELVPRIPPAPSVRTGDESSPGETEAATPVPPSE